ncbi:MAG: PRC-barrel domain-containing protein [Candidatus Magasanikbacteria bacterium]|nr:PRC-barrel domain-containing protein [Candidatus Magasanikbacteria bacterium]
MRISLKQFKKLPVETKSGKYIGRVRDVVFEIDGQLMAQYEVSPSLLSGKRYLISREQVLSISAEKMVVDDGVAGVDDKISVGSKIKIGKVEPEGVAMRE